jgi:hypothetical protein
MVTFPRTEQLRQRRALMNLIHTAREIGSSD